jgi:hypothetical protein
VAFSGGCVAPEFRSWQISETPPALFMRLHLPSTAAFHEPENDEKQDGTNCRRDDGGYHAGAKVDA